MISGVCQCIRRLASFQMSLVVTDLALASLPVSGFQVPTRSGPQLEARRAASVRLGVPRAGCNPSPGPIMSVPGFTGAGRADTNSQAQSNIKNNRYNRTMGMVHKIIIGQWEWFVFSLAPAGSLASSESGPQL